MEQGQVDSWRLQCVIALQGCPVLHME